MAPSNVENFSPYVIRQISKELCDLTQNPLEGIHVVFNEEDITSVQADVDGPSGTPYYGGSFRIRLVLGKNGEICVNTLKKDWNQDLGIKHVLLTIKCLLIVPNPESALNEEAGMLLLENYEDYCRRAKMMTEIHAPKAKSLDYNNGDCSQPTSSSINTNDNNITSNNSTLYDKTASSSTSANIGSSTQKQPLDGLCCGDEPVAKRLNSSLDCFNPTAEQQPAQPQPSSQPQLSTHKSQSSNPSSQSKVAGASTISNKNRGLKRVLRLRS